jgi:hypothetical protein
MRRNLIWTLLGVALFATLTLFFPAIPYLIRAIAAYLLTAVIPGILLVEVLLGREEISAWEKALYGVGVGYGTMVIGTLLLSYLPGGIEQWQMLAFYGGLIVLCGAVTLLRRPTPQGDHKGRTYSLWLIAGVLSILLVGGFLRLTGLDYAEFQGDEARAGLRAAAILQGYEDVLFLHRKGPTEIVIPTAIYALTGTLTEQAARLPFALSNLAALFALFALGWRLFGPVAGWSAAMLLALDGYFIGFAHIVQYQSIIFLTTLLAVLLLHRLVVFGNSPTLLLTTAAIILATGLHSHYEGIWAFIPAGYLLGMWVWNQWKAGRRTQDAGTTTHPLPPSQEGEKRNQPSNLVSRGGNSSFSFLLALIPPVVTGAVLLALFYVPFILHPNFSATYTYLADRRIGTSFPYNNLWDFFIRTTLYSTTYYVLLMIGLAAVALWWGYRKGLGRTTQNTESKKRKAESRMANFALPAPFSALIATVAVVFLAIFSVVSAPPTVVATVFVLVMVGIWLVPGLSHTERWLWLWFGIPMIVAFFFTEKPRTHVYVFFMPWALLVGMVIEMGFRTLWKRVGERNAITVGATIATLSVAVFANYAYWYFAHNQTEILRTWQANRPAGYLTVYDTPDENALFGFPISNGWKVVGALYEQGVISGDYESNEAEAWVPSWYTRGARRCARTADWYFQIDNLEPFSYGDQLAMEHYLRQGFKEWATVEINEQERMIIWHRTDEPVEPRLIPLREWEGYFDDRAVAQFPLDYPTVAPPEIANPTHINLGNEIWLEGYELEYDEPLLPGDTFRLTLYWRAQQPITANYKVFNQVYFGDSGMQAQLDGYPVCEGRATWRWDPGELITDTYYIQVREDATPGLYPLYSGMYIEETGARLPVLDEAGNQTDSQIHVTDIRIGEE